MLLHYLLKCRVLKATIENKTTSVTTHFKKLTSWNINRCSTFYLIIFLHVPSVVITDVIGIWSVFFEMPAIFLDTATRRRAVMILPGTHMTSGVKTSRLSSLAGGPQTARTWNLNPVDYAVWGALQQMVYQRQRDNEPAEAGDRHRVAQTVAAFHWSGHWSVASQAWVRRPAARRSHWTFDVTSSSAVADKPARRAASRFTTNGKICKQSRDHNHVLLWVICHSVARIDISYRLPVYKIWRL